ncbi:hypothetical protein PCASD_16457 [Puccinia coronata f. sp. avenae]|uniref:Tet-like 2OG-Fe(II) oxygenase domain-containing protein n=1 Tax=Puccinia coronata f. sp. avenae TaxID=200324 RepID=A0A2N5U3M3_9BASI|nr:hypothetical protein PCASD_16457 [Puccinia coronata f. sp. avenae]
MDNCLQKKLPLHNQFIAERFRHFSQDAYNQNKKALCEFGIPSWSDKEWESYTQDPSPLASNVIVISNNFSNKVHCDQDKNIFTLYVDTPSDSLIMIATSISAQFLVSLKCFGRATTLPITPLVHHQSSDPANPQLTSDVCFKYLIV